MAAVVLNIVIKIVLVSSSQEAVHHVLEFLGSSKPKVDVKIEFLCIEDV